MERSEVKLFFTTTEGIENIAEASYYVADHSFPCVEKWAHHCIVNTYLAIKGRFGDDINGHIDEIIPFLTKFWQVRRDFVIFAIFMLHHPEANQCLSMADEIRMNEIVVDLIECWIHMEPLCLSETVSIRDIYNSLAAVDLGLGELIGLEKFYSRVIYSNVIWILMANALEPASQTPFDVKLDIMRVLKMIDDIRHTILRANDTLAAVTRFGIGGRFGIELNRAMMKHF